MPCGVMRGASELAADIPVLIESVRRPRLGPRGSTEPAAVGTDAKAIGRVTAELAVATRDLVDGRRIVRTLRGDDHGAMAPPTLVGSSARLRRVAHAVMALLRLQRHPLLQSITGLLGPPMATLALAQRPSLVARPNPELSRQRVPRASQLHRLPYRCVAPPRSAAMQRSQMQRTARRLTGSPSSSVPAAQSYWIAFLETAPMALHSRHVAQGCRVAGHPGR